MAAPIETTATSPEADVRQLERGRLLSRLILGLVALGVSVVMAVTIGTYYRATPGELLTLLEIEVLGFTVLVLLLLSIFTAGSFTRDAAGIIESFQEQSRDLLTKSVEHWSAQTGALETAIERLNEVARLEAGVLEHTRQTMELSNALLAIERARDSLREEEARLRKQRIRPSMAVLPQIAHPGPIRKDIEVELFNQGGDARRVAVSLVRPTGEVLDTRPRPQVSAFATVDFGFGNIDEWNDAFEFQILVEADDEDSSRYAWKSTSIAYSRNRGLVMSDPGFDPAQWQYPPFRAVG